jgi:hypothetical protein
MAKHVSVGMVYTFNTETSLGAVGTEAGQAEPKKTTAPPWALEIAVAATAAARASLTKDIGIVF